VLPLDTTETELESYRKEYKTVLREEKEIWLSRLPESDRRVGSLYEVAHISTWRPTDGTCRVAHYPASGKCERVGQISKAAAAAT
jgi:hypothetical protein